jgi:CheY-like chemotaxis protein/glycine cleavage system H lipoate-binding protein
MNPRGDILLVDKDRTEASQYSDVLVKAGHEVSCAFCGKEAIQSVQSHLVDVVVSDFVLPDFDGIFLTRSMKNICKDLYVILMGEWPTVEFTKTAMVVGAYDVLSKPVKSERLMNLVDSAVAARHLKLHKADLDQVAGRSRIQAQDVVYDEQGLWTAPAADGSLEVGISVQGWTASGRMIYVILPDVGTKVRKGDVLFEIISGEGKLGRTDRMRSPIDGTVMVVNEDFNAELVRAVCNPCTGQCWLTPVLKIKP